MIDEEGRPCLKKHRAARPAETAVALEAALRERMPEPAFDIIRAV